jgi:hypothetical protein
MSWNAMDGSDLETLRKLLDDYVDASREVMDQFRSTEHRHAALHRRRRLEDEMLEQFPPPS